MSNGTPQIAADISSSTCCASTGSSFSSVRPTMPTTQVTIPRQTTRSAPAAAQRGHGALAEGTKNAVAGLDHERVTDPRALSPGQWLRFTKPLGDTGTMTLYLTVIEPVGRHADDAGVLCRRHGRVLMPTEQHILLTKPVIELGQVYRATTQPPHGIPGTWCDGYDSNGDSCGLSLHHHGDCRH